MATHQLEMWLRNADLSDSGTAFKVLGKGFMLGWGTSLPTDTVYAKGALFLKLDGAADANLYVNEASAGEGTTPSWTVHKATYAREAFEPEELVSYPIPVSAFRVHDAPSTVLPASAANDDLGVTDNSHGTAAPSIEAGDLDDAGATTRYGRFFFTVPPEYEEGETITLRVNAVMKTTAADTSCTLDAVVVRQAAPDADICATAAQDMNSTDAADLDFTITPTNVVVGDVLDVVLAIACTDSAGVGAVIPKINSVEMLLDIKG